jgi:hypothetical protein
VEEYKRLPRSEFLQTRSRKIVNRYIKENATAPISISDKARREVLERLEKQAGPNTFQPAQAEVGARLGND